MLKISYATGAYFGKRNVPHPKYVEDMTWYIQKHIEYINKQSHRIEKIYFVCTFDDAVDKNSILKKLHELCDSDERIVIKDRENLGAVYCSWKDAMHLDNGHSDYIILTEDDYILYDTQAVELMLEYFNKDADLFYLCQLWDTKPYNSMHGIIPAHAALPSGMINNRMYHKYRMEFGIDFRVHYSTGYILYASNQAEMLEPYRELGFKMVDWTKTYGSYYAHSDIEYGNPNGKKLIVGIDRDLGYF